MLSAKAVKLVGIALVVYFVLFIIRFELHSASIVDDHHGSKKGRKHDPQNLFSHDGSPVFSGEAAQGRHKGGKTIGHAHGRVDSGAPPTRHPVPPKGATTPQPSTKGGARHRPAANTSHGGEGGKEHGHHRGDLNKTTHPHDAAHAQHPEIAANQHHAKAAVPTTQVPHARAHHREPPHRGEHKPLAKHDDTPTPAPTLAAHHGEHKKAHQPDPQPPHQGQQQHQHSAKPLNPHVPQQQQHHAHRALQAANKHRHAHKAEHVVSVTEPVAFAVVVSNEDFIDGALVMGTSFWNQSHLVQIGNATLVAIIPEGAVSTESIERLKLAGWDHIYQVHDLTKYAAKAHYAGTFNKLYLFNLTQYHRVATFDVDMLMMKNPDSVFATHLDGPNWIGALGNSHRKNHSYFQTGMMLIVPTKETFGSLMHEFHSNPHQRDMNGRDGRLIRQYFQDRYVNLDSDLSAHLGVHEPFDHVIGFHYRGEFKPWFNKEVPPNKPAYGDKSGKVLEQEMGEAYRWWWLAYEHLHQTKLRAHDEAARPLDAPATYDPTRSMWLMRHTTRSYVQLLKSVDEVERDLTYPGLVVEASNVGVDCDQTCAARQAVCKHDALAFTAINHCDTLQRLFGCRSCTADYPGADEPSYDTATRVCYRNPLDYKHQRPLCNASMAGHRRLCPCVPMEHAYDHPTPRTVVGGDAATAPVVVAGQHDVVQNAPMEPADAHTVSGCLPSRSDFFASDARCKQYLGNLDNVEWVNVLGRASLVGRTAKLMLHYKERGLRAVVKLPQKSFPHEAHSEVAAYAVDRALNVLRVPPTVFAYLPLSMLHDAIANATSTNTDPTLELSLASMGEEVMDFLERQGVGALTRRRAATQEIEVGVSIQLWMNDVHRLVDSVFAEAAHGTVDRFFQKALTALTANKSAPVGATLAEVSRMVAFDFVIGNDDRTTTKNAFVLGGCRKYCVGASAYRHEGPPQLVLVDQGRSFYYDGNPEDNVLSNGPHTGKVCAFPEAFIKVVLDASHNRTTLGSLTRSDVKQHDPKHLANNNDEAVVNPRTLEKQLFQALSKETVRVITSNALHSAQNRLERFLDHVARCVQQHSEASVLLKEGDG